MSKADTREALFQDESSWDISATTAQRIEREAFCSVLVEIVDQSFGTIEIDHDPTNHNVAEILPKDAGMILVSWRDCVVNPTTVPNEQAHLICLCGDTPRTQVGFAILGLDAEAEDLTATEFEKVDRALVALAARVAERFPGLVFYEQSGTIYEDEAIIRLAQRGKSRGESWDRLFTVARILREKQEWEKVSNAVLGVVNSQPAESSSSVSHR